MFWKRHVAMHKTGMSFIVIKRHSELLQLMWLRKKNVMSFGAEPMGNTFHVPWPKDNIII